MRHLPNDMELNLEENVLEKAESLVIAQFQYFKIGKNKQKNKFDNSKNMSSVYSPSIQTL